MGFSGGLSGKESACNVGYLGLIPQLGRSPGEGKSYPLQYSVLENSMDCIVPGIAELDMTEQLSFHFTFLNSQRQVLEIPGEEDLHGGVKHDIQKRSSGMLLDHG